MNDMTPQQKAELKARIQAQTAEYLATGKVGNEVTAEVAPPKGWDSAEA